MIEPNASKTETYRFGAFRLDLLARRLHRGDEEVALPPKAFELLQLLVRNAGRAMTRTELLDAIWRDTVVEEGSLSWNVSVLRKSLGDEAGEIVQTVRGYGYRFGLAVEREPEREPAPPSPASGPAERDAERPAEESAPAAAVRDRTRDDLLAAAPREESPGTSPPVAKRGAPARVALLALAVALAAFVAFFLAARGKGPPSPAAKPGSDGTRSALAVIPFENLSARPEDAWLATAISELLASELAQGGGTSTIASETVARAASDIGLHSGAGVAPATVARLRERLGFDYLVVGSFLVVGSPATVRVDLRLQDAADASTRFAWSESRTLDELPSLVSGAGESLRRELGAERGAGGDAASEPTAVGAYRAPTEGLRLYAEGLELRRRFQFRAAREKFEQALAVAPEFVLARAALADLLGELGNDGEAIAASREALRGAADLAPAERLPIVARNHELERRWSEAADRWRELARLEPGALEPALAIARAESRAGHHAAARAQLDALGRRPPPVGTDARIAIERGWAERYAQRFTEMKAAGERAVALGRALPSEYVQAEALSVVAWADLTLGDHAAGLAACEEGLRLSQKIGHGRLAAIHSDLCGYNLGSLGRGEEAERSFRNALELAVENGDSFNRADSLQALAILNMNRSRLGVAADLELESLRVARQAGDEEHEVTSLDLLAQIELARGRLAEAERYAREGLEKARALNVAGRIAGQLNALGRILRWRGDLASSRAAHEEAVQVTPASLPGRLAWRRLDLAATRLSQGDALGALELCGQVSGTTAAERIVNLTTEATELLCGLAEAELGRSEAARERLRRVDRAELPQEDEVRRAELLLMRADLLAALHEETGAERVWREIVEDPAFGEFELIRSVARYRLALRRAESGRGASARGERAAAEAAARTARLGLLIGEKL
ncbi:MAG: winged helix-turn-helix domain-containing protein [Thermoanaerobaculia bacterium]